MKNSTKVSLPMAGHEGESWSIVRPRRTYKNALYRAARALEAPTRSPAVTYVKGCDTIYRVLEGVTKTLSKTWRWAVHQSTKTLPGAHGCNAERRSLSFNPHVVLKECFPVHVAKLWIVTGLHRYHVG